MPLLITRIAIVLFLFACYPIAQFLPVHAGWENGIVESVQLSFLMMGALLSLYFAYNEKQSQWRWFALMVAPIWILLIGRELSWGTTFLFAPLSIHPETGPVYSSSLQLTFKPVTRVIAILLVLFTVAIFFITKQYKSLVTLFKLRIFPWFEIIVALIGTILVTAAEGHGFFEITALSAGQYQTLEELFELGVYMTIFVAQASVFHRLKEHFK